MQRLLRLILLGGALLAAAASAMAGDDAHEGEPGHEECLAAVEQARKAIAVLPAGSMALRFAESDLHQALVEAGNGEYDDCVERAERAEDEARRPRHDVRVGDAFEHRRDGERSRR